MWFWRLNFFVIIAACWNSQPYNISNQRISENSELVSEYINPLFPHELWNVYDRLISGLPRTTNAVEGWHSAFWSATCKYLDIYISCMVKENATMHYKIAQNVARVPAELQKRTYSQVNIQVSSIVSDCRNRNIINYLRALSHTIAFKQSRTSLQLVYTCLCTFYVLFLF